MTAISDTDVLTNCMRHLLHHRELFYLQLRADMKCGDLSVPESRVGLVGALLAQSEMGNPPEASIPPLIYPPYFAKWEQGYPRRIALEHRKLNGKEICSVCVLVCACVSVSELVCMLLMYVLVP